MTVTTKSQVIIQCETQAEYDAALASVSARGWEYIALGFLLKIIVETGTRHAELVDGVFEAA